MIGRTLPLGLGLALALALACGGDDGGPTTGTDGGSSSTTGMAGSTGSTGEVTTSGTGSTTAADDSGGRVVSFGGECKMAADSFPLNQECMSYSYVDGNLSITHGNAALNCCVDQVDVTFEVVGDAIKIAVAEAEGFSPCDCNCLFNVDYQFDMLPVGTYTVTLENPYVPMGDAPLSQQLNLAMTPIGLVCADRSAYPWM